ncbi:hypothetical protein R1flu_028620 [Riccia fluitans]|uniref:Uncharacterized protein n=1 Tax=Riccia fluitans TaxID=41844 RepID=A0ABD1XM98_9MARC
MGKVGRSGTQSALITGDIFRFPLQEVLGLLWLSCSVNIHHNTLVYVVGDFGGVDSVLGSQAWLPSIVQQTLVASQTNLLMHLHEVDLGQFNSLQRPACPQRDLQVKLDALETKMKKLLQLMFSSFNCPLQVLFRSKADFSMSRSDPYFQDLFQQGGLHVYQQRKETAFLREL